MDLDRRVKITLPSSFGSRSVDRRAVRHPIRGNPWKSRDAERRVLRLDAAYREPGKLGLDASRDPTRSERQPPVAALQGPVRPVADGSTGGLPIYEASGGGRGEGRVDVSTGRRRSLVSESL